MSRWCGKIAVVTGASSGIGAAVAQRLVESGLIVVGIARRKDLLEELSTRLENEGNTGKLHTFKADLTKEGEIFSAFSWIKDNLGPVSILVNNAGLARKTTLIDGNINDWRQIIDTNLLATAVCSREAINSMKENGIDGHIVNLNSVCGHRVPDVPNVNIYPATKFAVTALSQTMRNELVAIGSKIKISCVSPGVVDTEIWTTSKFAETKDDYKEFLADVPNLKSEDVADAVCLILETPPHVQITELTITPVGATLFT